MGIVRTRFAPSPTGPLHLGNARTALFNYLFARRNKGSFILRIEDTDRARSTYDFERAIYEDLRWLGLEWDEGPDKGGPFGPYRQSERSSIYAGEAERLVSEGKAYRCYCSKERLEELKASQAAAGKPSRYDGRCRDLKPGDAPIGAPSVVRFKVPSKEVLFMDGVHGLLSFDSRTIGDFVIMGSDGVAAYNFAVVADDALMSVSHVIRGDDHISNTPRQVLLFEALGLKTPIFSHVPLVLGPDKTPLSKRHGEFSLKGLRDEGFLPEAVINAAARLGWNPGEGMMTLDELAEAFSIDRLSKSASSFDEGRLKSYNKEAIQMKDAAELSILIGLNTEAAGIIGSIKGNASTLKELETFVRPFLTEPEPGPAELEELKEEHAKKVIMAFRAALEAMPEPKDDSYRELTDRVKAETGEKGRRLLMPLRLALTGMREGVELANVLKLLGREEAIKRLKRFEN